MTCCLLKNCKGLCLAVWWLELHAPNARVLGSVPSWGLRSGKLHGKASPLPTHPPKKQKTKLTNTQKTVKLWSQVII